HRLVDQQAEDRQLEHQTVHEHLDFFAALPRLHEEVEAATQPAEDQPPVLHEKFAHADHEQYWRRQVGAKGGEHFFECRDHEDHDHGHDNERDHDHRDRIHQRRLDLRLDALGFFH